MMKLKRIACLLLCGVLTLSTLIGGEAGLMLVSADELAYEEIEIPEEVLPEITVTPEVTLEVTPEVTTVPETTEEVMPTIAVEPEIKEEGLPNATEAPEKISPQRSRAEGDVAIDVTNFPDVKFRDFITLNYDLNNDGQLSLGERNKVTGMSVIGKAIEDLKGIEHFVNLEELHCYSNNLMQLDLSKNDNLVYLDCDDNNIENLNVSNMANLQTLYCQNNRLTNLDISKNTSLESLYCRGNAGLKRLNLTKNTKLVRLFCDDDVQLVMFDNSEKITVSLKENTLSSVEMSWNKISGARGYEISCSIGKAGNYKVLGYTEGNAVIINEQTAGETYYYRVRAYNNLFEVVYSSYSEVKSIKKGVPVVKGAKFATSSADVFEIEWAEIEGVTGYEVCRATSKAGTYTMVKDVVLWWDYPYYKDESLKSGTTYYYKIRAYKTVNGVKHYGAYSGIISKKATVSSKLNIDATNFKDAIFRQYLSSNFDTDWDGKLSDAEIKKVKKISWGNNRCASLKGIEHFYNLEELIVYNTNITSLDLSKNTKLKYLSCTENKLSKLVVNKNPQLTELYCQSNKLTSLDVSKNTKLVALHCHGNKIKKLDLSKNTKLKYLQASISTKDKVKVTIFKAKPKVTVENTTATAVKVKWNKVTGATGYKVYFSTSKNGKYKELKTVKGHSYTHKGLTIGKKYYYKVRAYRDMRDEPGPAYKIYGSYSSVVGITKALPKVAGVKVANSGKQSLKVSWKKVSGSTGYTVYRASSKTGKYKEVKNIKASSSSYTDKKLKAGQTYFYKVRAYKMVGRAKKYGAYSGIVSRTTK